MPGRRAQYIDSIRYWMSFLEPIWSEEETSWCNPSYVPALAVLALEGDKTSRMRLEKILARWIQTPPWDDKNHYFSALDRLGLEPHGGNTQTGKYLCLGVKHAEELGLSRDLKEAVLDRVRKMLARWAQFSAHAKDVPASSYADQNWKPMSVAELIAIRNECIRKGVPEDFSTLKEIGPKNQVCAEMQAAAHLYCLTGEERVWSWVEGFWNRVLDRVEGSKPYPYPVCFDPDYSFIYSVSESHRFETSMYAIHIFALYADVVRIAREVGKPNPAWEEFIRNWSAALFSRAVFADGTCNLVLNGYGWDRCFLSCAARAHVLHAAIPIADLTPYSPGELRYLADSTDRWYRQWKAEQTLFAGDLGLKGFYTSTPRYSLSFLVQEYGAMLLSNPASVEVDPVKPSDSLLGFSWHQKYFVMQTPVYQLTCIGSGTGLHPNGFGDSRGFGIVPSGGEYVIRLPGGRYLTPISEWGRPSIEVKAGKITVRSSDIRLSNLTEYAFAMNVTLPTGEVIEKGEPFDRLPFDPHVTRARADISYGKGPITVGRSFDLDRDSILVTDFVQARKETRKPVLVESAKSTLPLITVAADGAMPRITGLFGEVQAELKPPRHMGSTSDVQQRPDQVFIQSLRSWSWLAIDYPDCNVRVECLTPRDLGFGISAGEWHEDSRMRVDGKDLEVFWLREPVRLQAGERRELKLRFHVVLKQARAPDLGGEATPSRL